MWEYILNNGALWSLENLNHKHIAISSLRRTLTRKHCQTGCFLLLRLHDTTFEYAAKSVELTHVNAEREDRNWRFRGEMASNLRCKQNEL